MFDEELLTDEQIEYLEDRGVDLNDPRAVKEELDLQRSMAEDNEIDSGIERSRCQE
jgi:hypothetical protein